MPGNKKTSLIRDVFFIVWIFSRILSWNWVKQKKSYRNNTYKILTYLLSFLVHCVQDKIYPQFQLRIVAVSAFHSPNTHVRVHHRQFFRSPLHPGEFWILPYTHRRCTVRLVPTAAICRHYRQEGCLTRKCMKNRVRIGNRFQPWWPETSFIISLRDARGAVILSGWGVVNDQEPPFFKYSFRCFFRFP